MMFLLECISQSLYLSAKATSHSVFIFQSSNLMSRHLVKAAVTDIHLKLKEKLFERQEWDFCYCFRFKRECDSRVLPAAFIQSQTLKVKTSHGCIFFLGSLICQKHANMIRAGRWRVYSTGQILNLRCYEKKTVTLSSFHFKKVF